MRVVNRQCIVVRGRAVIGRSESGPRRGKALSRFAPGKRWAPRRHVTSGGGAVGGDEHGHLQRGKADGDLPIRPGF